MTEQVVAMLAAAISAPIVAAIYKLVPQRGVKYDGPPTETLMTTNVCRAERDVLDARLLRAERSITALNNATFPQTEQDANQQ